MKLAVLATCLLCPSLLLTADTTSMGFNDILDIVSKTGILGFVLLILWTGKKGLGSAGRSI